MLVLLPAVALAIRFRGLVAAALEDRWWHLRLVAALGAVAASQVALWLAARTGHAAAPPSPSTWRFFEDVLPPQSRPRWGVATDAEVRARSDGRSAPGPDTTPLSRGGRALGVLSARELALEASAAAPAIARVHIAVRATGKNGQRLSVIVRGRARGIRHRVDIESGKVAVAPGTPEELLGPDLLGRLGALCARLPSLRATTEEAAFFLVARELTATEDSARELVNVLRELVREVVGKLLEADSVAFERAGYRGALPRADGTGAGEQGAVFAPMDRGEVVAWPCSATEDLSIEPPALGPIAPAPALAGSALLVVAALMSLGAVRVAQSAGSRGFILGSAPDKELGASAAIAMAVALMGIVLQALAVAVRSPAPQGIGRVGKVALVLLALVLLAGMGSCVAR